MLALSIIIGVLAGFFVVHPNKVLIGIPAAMFFLFVLMILTPMFSDEKREKKIIVNLALGHLLLEL